MSDFFDLTDCNPPGSSVHGNFPSKNMGVGCHFLLQGIIPTQESNLCLLRLLRRKADSLPPSHLGIPKGIHMHGKKSQLWSDNTVAHKALCAPAACCLPGLVSWLSLWLTTVQPPKSPHCPSNPPGGLRLQGLWTCGSLCLVRYTLPFVSFTS